MAEYWIGVDIGGTNIVCGAVNDEGRLLAMLKRPTPVDQGSDAVMDRVAVMVQEMLRANQLDIHSVAGAGIGTPGHVDPIAGKVLQASNLNWRDVPIAAGLSSRLEIPVFADNDVRMYVYGEAKVGAGKHFANVLGITIGTGLAAAFVYQGQLLHGSQFLAGEIGHIPMNEISYPCVCGLTGCLETMASGTGIVRQARDYLQAGHPTLLRQIPSEQIASEEVSKACDAGDRLAIDIMNRTGRLLGKGLAAAITLFSPDVLVIGGGVAAAGDRLLQPMKEAIRELVYEGYWSHLTISVARHPELAGVMGSAIFAKERLARSRSNIRCIPPLI